MVASGASTTERDAPRAPRPLLAYFGHHRCASTWLGDIVRDVCAASGLRTATVTGPHEFGGDLRGFTAARRVDFLVYGNANRRFVTGLGDYRGFHVIRDPRDIVVSSYFSHLHSHPTEHWPELIQHRRELQSVDRTQGILLVIDFIADVLDDIATWDYGDPRVLEMRLEDMIKAPEASLLRALTHVGVVDASMNRVAGGAVRVASRLRRRSSRLVPFRLLPLPGSLLVEIVGGHSFATMANGRQPGTEDVGSHYRKGVAGDWVNYFESTHKAYFKARYGRLLQQLGYEKDQSW